MISLKLKLKDMCALEKFSSFYIQSILIKAFTIEKTDIIIIIIFLSRALVNHCNGQIEKLNTLYYLYILFYVYILEFYWVKTWFLKVSWLVMGFPPKSVLYFIISFVTNLFLQRFYKLVNTLKLIFVPITTKINIEKSFGMDITVHYLQDSVLVHSSSLCILDFLCLLFWCLAKKIDAENWCLIQFTLFEKS